MKREVLTPADIKWLREKLREDFDKPFDYGNISLATDTIDRAERFGFTEMAEQMRKDLNIPSREQVTGEPSDKWDSIFFSTLKDDQDL